MDLTKNKYMIQKRRSLADRNRHKKKGKKKLSLPNGRLDLATSSITKFRLTRPIGIYSRGKTSDPVLRGLDEDTVGKGCHEEELPLPETQHVKLVDLGKSKNNLSESKLNSDISIGCRTSGSRAVTGHLNTPFKCDLSTPQPKLRLSRQPVSCTTETSSSSSLTSKSTAIEDIPLDDILDRLKNSLIIQNEALFPNKNWETELRRELQETYYSVRRHLVKSTSEYSQHNSSERCMQNEETAALCSHTISSAVNNRSCSQDSQLLQGSNHGRHVDRGGYSNQPFRLFLTDAHTSSQEDSVYRPVFMDRGDGSRFPTVDLGVSCYTKKTLSGSLPEEDTSHLISKIEPKFNPDFLDSLDSSMAVSAESVRTNSTCIISDETRSRRRYLNDLAGMSSDSDGSPVWQLVRSPSPLRPPPASQESWKFTRRRMY